MYGYFWIAYFWARCEYSIQFNERHFWWWYSAYLILNCRHLFNIIAVPMALLFDIFGYKLKIIIRRIELGIINNNFPGESYFIWIIYERIKNYIRTKGGCVHLAISILLYIVGSTKKKGKQKKEIRHLIWSRKWLPVSIVKRQAIFYTWKMILYLNGKTYDTHTCNSYQLKNNVRHNM